MNKIEKLELKLSVWKAKQAKANDNTVEGWYIKGWVDCLESALKEDEHDQAKSCIMFTRCRYAELPDCNGQCRHKPSVG